MSNRPEASPAPPPRDGVRGLLAIALAWTVVVTALVAVHPVNADRAAGGARTTFEIVSVDGVTPEDRDGGSYTVGRDTVDIVLEITGPGDVECWNQDTDDVDWSSGGSGIWTLEVGLQEGRNTIECTTSALFPQSTVLSVVYEPDGSPTAAPGEPTVPPTPRATSSGEPDLFAITSIDGRNPGSVVAGMFTVHEPSVRIDIDQRTPATVSCWNQDAGWTWETEPRVAAQYLEIDLRPGTNAIVCRAGKGAGQEVRFEVVFVVDPTPSPDPDAVVITTIDGYPRNTIPDHGYTTWSTQIIVRGSAPDPGSVVCLGSACDDRELYATGPTTWAVQLQLFEGLNRIEVHAADDPSNSDQLTVELVP